MEDVKHRDIAGSLESIVKSRCNGGNEDCFANDHDIVEVDWDQDAISFAGIAPEAETSGCNCGVEIEIVNDKVKDFFIVLSIRLLDAK